MSYLGGESNPKPPHTHGAIHLSDSPPPFLSNSGGISAGGLRVGGFSFLKSIPILQSLSEAQLSKLSASLESRRFMDGDVIINQGDPGNTFYVIETGEVVVTVKEFSSEVRTDNK